MKIDLSLANPDNRVEYELWYSSILDMSVEAVAQPGEYQKPFGNDTLFTPRLVTFSCPLCPEYIRKQNCVSDGKYCPYRGRSHEEEAVSKNSALSYNFQSDGDTSTRSHQLANNIPDIELIMENLRSKCVYQHTVNVNSPTDGQWFRYMYAMNTLVLSNGELSKEWSDKILTQIGISPDKILQCVNNSFVEPGNYQSDNKILKEDRWWQRLQDV